MAVIGTYYLVVGDLSPSILYQTVPKENLTGVVSVTFNAWDAATRTLKIDDGVAAVASGLYLINGVLTNVVPADGILVYNLGPADVDVSDTFHCQFTVVFQSGLVTTSPNKKGDYLVLEIAEKIT
jgi:hypothetical protein